MKLIDLLLGDTVFRFERGDDGEIYIYDDTHDLCALVEERGRWIKYCVTGMYNSGCDVVEINVTALRKLEEIAGKIAEDLEDDER